MRATQIAFVASLVALTSCSPNRAAVSAKSPRPILHADITLLDGTITAKGGIVTGGMASSALSSASVPGLIAGGPLKVGIGRRSYYHFQRICIEARVKNLYHCILQHAFDASDFR